MFSGENVLLFVPKKPIQIIRLQYPMAKERQRSCCWDIGSNRNYSKLWLCNTNKCVFWRNKNLFYLLKYFRYSVLHGVRQKEDFTFKVSFEWLEISVTFVCRWKVTMVGVCQHAWESKPASFHTTFTCWSLVISGIN